MKKIILFCPPVLFVIDRIIKHFAPSINIEGGFVKVGFYQNYSGAFSLPIAGWLYNAAGIFFVLVFIFLFFRSLRGVKRRSRSCERSAANSVVNEIAAPSVPLRARNDSMAYALIFLGGASNIFDRLAYGYVIDYFNFFNYSFFNIADGMLLAGIVILLYCQSVKNKKQFNNLPC